MLEEERRMVFTKVFMWMFIGLAITFGIGYYVSSSDIMIENVSKYYLGFIIAELVVVLILSLKIRSLQPMTAKILFCAYSFLTGLTFSSIFVVYELTSIIFIFGITSLIFLIFALIGYFTKIDLSKLGVYLFMLLIGVIICSIINIFVGSEKFDLGISIICLIVFIVYIAYDMQVIKRNLFSIPNTDNLAIYGALQLYLDFINIFIKLLRFFANRKN